MRTLTASFFLLTSMSALADDGLTGRYLYCETGVLELGCQ